MKVVIVDARGDGWVPMMEGAREAADIQSPMPELRQ